jgi:hypothetical protein
MSHSQELQDRARRAAQIVAKPGGYKICEGCESIVVKKAITCPNCHGYRFDCSADRVIEQAKFLGSRPATSVSLRDFE